MWSATGGGLPLRRSWILPLLACLCVVSGGALRAELITDTYLSFPNLEATGVYGGYTAVNGHFWAEGYPASYSITASSEQDLMPIDGFTSWSFSIDAQLDPLAPTPMPASGTVFIYGSTTGIVGSGELLLQGDIEAFGLSIDPSLDSATTLFDFAFHVTGGAYAADYGNLARIILSPAFITGWGAGMDDTPCVGTPLQDFSFNGPGGVADVVSIPESDSRMLAFTLLAAGYVLYISRRHRTRRGV
jgi:hypothetical protein